MVNFSSQENLSLSGTRAVLAVAAGCDNRWKTRPEDSPTFKLNY